MKKVQLLIIFFFNVVFGYGQELPNVIPPSPEAFALTKYGDLPINESTGKMMFQLPIYTYKEGNLSLPISLNYLGNGVKVNDLSTWTGINWTLNAGGVITRTVYHKPDEVVAQRIFAEDIAALNLYNYYDDASTLALYFSTDSNMWDTQPDIFTFSFLNYSGSFFLDRNFNPILVKGDLDLRIEIEGTQNTKKEKLAINKHFIITTPDGIKYFFGKNEIQNTQRQVVGAAHQVVTPFATTSFYLYKIEDSLNGKIFLEYVKTDAYSIIESENQSSAKYYNFESSNGHNHKLIEEGVKNTSIVNQINEGVFLSHIYSQNSSIEVFFNLNTNSINGRNNFSKILKNIEIKNSATILSKIDLNYIYNTNDFGITQRFFLKEVIFKNGIVARKFKKYVFDYKNAANLPDRLSYSQDHLGYYNGANNQWLLKIPENSPYTFGIPSSADRNSDFETRSTGVLTKITYPTKGFSKIEYEAPMKKQKVNKNVILETYINGYQNNIYDKQTDTYVIGGLFVDEDGNEVIEDGAYKTEMIDIDITILSETTLLLHQSELINIDIIDTTTGITTHERVVIISPDTTYDDNYYIYDFSTSFELLKNHKYQIKLNLEPDTDFNTELDAKLKFTYTRGEELIDGEGVRVKKTSDFENLTSTPKNIKRYYYTKITNIQKDPITYVETYKVPSYILGSHLPYKEQLIEQEGPVLNCNINSANGGILQSYPINYNEQIINNYENVVISYGGDYFENGGIEKTFGKDIICPIVNIQQGGEHVPKQNYNFLSPNLTSTLHGQLLKEIYIKKKNDVLFKTKETQQYKSYINSSFIFGHLFDYVVGCGAIYGEIQLDKYNLFERRINISTTTTKEFIDPYPIVEDALGNLPDEDNYNKIVITKTVNYNSTYKGLPTEIEVTGDMLDKNILINNEYVDNKNNLDNPQGGTANLSSDELLAYTALENTHNIIQPIQVEKYIKNAGNNTLMSTKRTLYKNTPEGKVVPKKIQISKGQNNLEDRIIFSKYDANGNLTEVSYKDGSKIHYTYNGRGQVITKIENYQVPINGSVISQDNINLSICNRSTKYPNSLVTTFEYDSVNHLLNRIINPRCESTYYEYDIFQKLQYIKDNEGNILEEYDYNYRE